MVKHGIRHVEIIHKITAVILVISIVLALAGCSKDNSSFDGRRFAKTRHITVLTDYITGSGTDITVNSCQAARYIHDSVLRDCNIDVEFIESYKYSLLNGITADISYTGDSNMLTTYYKMGAVLNIAPYLDQYSDSLTDLTALLGDENIYSCTDTKDEVWYLTPRKSVPDARVTFIRSDWLEKLDLDAPKTKAELYDCLIAFRDNAELLLGEESDKMIPFFIDNEPNISAKPLFDSYLDTDISDKDFFVNGYCRVTQPGYKDGLKTLNEWYLEDLLPERYTDIRPRTKESYEPIENGFVGAFCAKSDYLYKNGENSHIAALKDNQGNSADYIAVNCFENSKGQYTSWEEDYLKEGGDKVVLPATCEDPLASLVYLNWISDPDNIKAIQELKVDDPYSSDRFLLTFKDTGIDEAQYPEAGEARKTAMDVSFIQRGNKCIRYNPYYFKFVKGDTDYASLYPDSTGDFVCDVISSDYGTFEDVFTTKFDEYGTRGAYVIYYIRNDNWEKVMVNGDMTPW